MTVENDICSSCAFCDACPSAHFHPYEKTTNICAFYKSMLEDGKDGSFFRKTQKENAE